MHRRAPSRLVAVVVSCGLAGCMVGPDYERPTTPTPAAYKEQPPVEGAWKTAQPRLADGSASLWSRFGDATLDGLIAEASSANQTVVQAEANYRASRAAVALARSALYPTLGAVAGFTRSRTPASTIGGAGRNGVVLGNTHSLELEASWEPDLWGGVRRSIEAADATAQSSAATLAATRLSIHAEVAQDYLALRVNDELHDLFARSVDSYQRALQLSQSQFRAGTVSRSDVALATALLKSTQSLLTDTAATRAVYEHAIALLLGKPPADFSLPPAKLEAGLPAAPVGLPADLLERRPDIAIAERAAAAANAEIGVAKAAYYPLATLSAGGGSLASLGQFFSAPGRVWTLGATLAQTIFDGGARRAQTDRAIANYDATVANYRETVLAGFVEVEDNLATLRVLEQEQGTDDEAVTASRDAERIALSQYRAGTVTYLSVITAENTALSNERLAVQLRGRRFAASVTLIRALGGDWDGTTAGPSIATATIPTPAAAPAIAFPARDPPSRRPERPMKPESFREPPHSAPTDLRPSAGPPARSFRWSRIVLVLVVIALLAWAAWAWSGKREKPASPPPPVQATLAPVVAEDFAVYLSGVGNVLPLQSVTVKARVDGQLQQLGYTEGQDVRAGQLIAQIDPRPFQATLAQLVAQRARDQATLVNARLDLGRYNDLIKEEATSQQTLDTQKAAVAQDEAAIKTDDAQIAGARTQLDYTTITAPISGRTGLRLVDVGNIVHAADTTGLVVIDQIDPISVVFTLPDAAFQQVNAAMRGSATPLEALAYSRDEQSKPLARGTLVLIDNHIDTTSGTVQIKAVFPNAKHGLWPGQYVNVRLYTETRKQAIVIPSAGVLRSQKGTYAYVVDGDAKARVQPIRVALIQDGMAVVDQGLQVGERVVIDGQYKVKPGVTVTAVAPATATAGGASPAAATNATDAATASGNPAQRSAPEHANDRSTATGK